MFEARVADIEALARDQGLDFFPTSYEVVPQDIMTEVAAYGLPTRARQLVLWQGLSEPAALRHHGAVKNL